MVEFHDQKIIMGKFMLRKYCKRHHRYLTIKVSYKHGNTCYNQEIILIRKYGGNQERAMHDGKEDVKSLMLGYSWNVALLTHLLPIEIVNHIINKVTVVQFDEAWDTRNGIVTISVAWDLLRDKRKGWNFIKVWVFLLR